MAEERERLLGNKILHYNSVEGGPVVDGATSAYQDSSQIDVDTSSIR